MAGFRMEGHIYIFIITSGQSKVQKLPYSIIICDNHQTIRLLINNDKFKFKQD